MGLYDKDDDDDKEYFWESVLCSTMHFNALFHLILTVTQGSRHYSCLVEILEGQSSPG